MNSFIFLNNRGGGWGNAKGYLVLYIKKVEVS